MSINTFGNKPTGQQQTTHLLAGDWSWAWGEKLREGQRNPGFASQREWKRGSSGEVIRWRVCKENFHCVFNDCIIFHHQYTIIDLTTCLFLSTWFSVINNAEINIFTSLFSSFELLLRVNFQKWDYYWLKKYEHFCERLFFKRLLTQLPAMYYCTGFTEPGQHWVLSFSIFWANIITVKCSIFLISTALIAMEHNFPPPCPRVWLHLVLVSFCQIFSWAISVCDWCFG